MTSRDPAADRAVAILRRLDAEKTDGPIRAEPLERLWARVIDFWILLAAVVVVDAFASLFAIVVLGLTLVEDLKLTTAGSTVGWVSTGVTIALAITHEVGLTWFKGGTLGKLRVGLKVVDRRGGPVTLRQAVVRCSMWAVPLVLCLIGFGATFPRSPGWSLVFFLGMFASLGLMVWAFVDADGRGLHDRLAGTRVVAEQ